MTLAELKTLGELAIGLGAVLGILILYKLFFWVVEKLEL